MDENTIEDYMKLKNQLYDIKKFLNISIDSYHNLMKELRESMVIDNEIIYNDKFNENLTSLDNIKTNLNDIIRSVNSKS